MTNNITTKRFRVAVVEWLAYKAIIEAPDAEAAEAMARQLWADNADHTVFHFDDSGIDGIEVEPVEGGAP